MEQRRKEYVEVNVDHRPDGSCRPNRIKLENGETYEPFFLTKKMVNGLLNIRHKKLDRRN